MSGKLLRVDFEAALAKLAPAQLQGIWQLPTELARLMIASGARRLDLQLERSRLTVRASGARPSRALIRGLATLLDGRIPPAERHGALVDLETRDALAFAALAAFPGRRLEVRASGLRLTQARGKAPRLEQVVDDGDGVVELMGCALDAERASRFLERHGRFAALTITINGRKIYRGFRNALVRTRLRRPLPAALAIAASGEAPRLWLLRHSIIATRATVPGYPAFEAAVEMTPLERKTMTLKTADGVSPARLSRTTGADLREAIQPYLETLIDAAMELLALLGREAEVLTEEARERTARLLIQAVRQGLRPKRLRRVRVFPLLGKGGVREMASLGDLEELVQLDTAKRRFLDAIDPAQSASGFALAGRRVLVLQASERKLLGEVLDVQFRIPPQRPRPRHLPGRWLAGLLGEAALLWHGFLGHLVGEEALSAPEQAFLDTLREEAPSCSAVFRRGGGRVRLAHGGRLLLPRDHPVVRASIRAVAHDPGWLYPALLGLLGGHEMPPSELRAAWRTPAVEETVPVTFGEEELRASGRMRDDLHPAG